MAKKLGEFLELMRNKKKLHMLFDIQQPTAHTYHTGRVATRCEISVCFWNGNGQLLEERANLFIVMSYVSALLGSLCCDSGAFVVRRRDGWLKCHDNGIEPHSAFMAISADHRMWPRRKQCVYILCGIIASPHSLARRSSRHLDTPHILKYDSRVFTLYIIYRL